MIKQSDYSMTVKTIIGEISMCMSLKYSVKNTDRKWIQWNDMCSSGCSSCGIFSKIYL